MNCSFCSVTAFNGNHYRYRPIEDIIEEWKHIPQKYVAIVDDNLMGNTREAQQRAIELFTAIESTGHKKQWIGEASLSIADNDEVLRTAARSGCKTIFLGVETEREDQLKSANKKVNLRIGSKYYDHVFRKIQKHGIGAIAGFIFGWPSETYETIDNRIEFMRHCRADTIQATLLTPLPGTVLFHQLEKENRIELNHYPEDWKFYDSGQLVFHPDKMERLELQKYYFKKIARLYRPSEVKRRFYLTWLRTRKLSTAYMTYMSHIIFSNVLFGIIKPGNIKWVERVLGIRKSKLLRSLRSK